MIHRFNNSKENFSEVQLNPYINPKNTLGSKFQPHAIRNLTDKQTRKIFNLSTNFQKNSLTPKMSHLCKIFSKIGLNLKNRLGRKLQLLVMTNLADTNKHEKYLTCRQIFRRYTCNFLTDLTTFQPLATARTIKKCFI